jgi:hypothetical protein
VDEAAKLWERGGARRRREPVSEAVGALCDVTIQLQGDYEADIDIHMKIIEASRSSNAWLQHAPPPKQTKHVVFDQVGDATQIGKSGVECEASERNDRSSHARG